MGYGPSPAPKRTWKQVLLPEYGTYMEFRKLKAAEREKAKQAKEGGEPLSIVSRGQYAAFDQFTDLLEHGAAVSRHQRKYLVGIPVVLMFLCGATFGTSGYLVFVEGMKSNAATAVQEHSYLVQLAIIMLCFTMVCLCASISPTSIKQIYYTNVGLGLYFAVCGAILCPLAMPMLLPDKTGTVYKLWMLCGVVKCYGYILTNTWAVCTQPPRKCLRIMEWGLMVVCVGIGIFTMFANYFCMLDYGAELPPHWFRNYVFMSLTCCAIGYMAITDVPRVLGKKFLVLLHSIQSPDTSFDQQVLAATITIMVGADSGFREILSAALRSLRCVSMADVTWDEFKENTPNPKCYSKSRAVSFKEIDYFISHSWSDDPHAKWAAVQEMRTTFKKANGREPLVWFDKYCIDQNAIDQSVRRLPIFVVASRKFYVLLGPSYATRCWCMLELFVFKACQRCGLFSDTELVIAPLKTSGTNMHLADLASTFNIHHTKCFRDVDRQTIFGIVETAGDGAIGFTEAVRSLAKAAGEQVGGEMPPVSEMPGASDAPTAKLRRRASGASVPPSPPSPTACKDAAAEVDVEVGADTEVDIAAEHSETEEVELAVQVAT